MSTRGGGSDDVTPAALAEPGPHPLAAALAATLDAAARAPRVLILGIGSGRNVPVLLGAGASVDVVEEDAERAAAAARRFADEPRVRVIRARYGGPVPFAAGLAAALSTHALLHGTPRAIAAAIEAARERLLPGAAFFATLGSKRDPRFAAGRPVAPDTFAPLAGAEAGVAHAFFDEFGVRELFARFTLEDVLETNAGAFVGRWAHAEGEAGATVHWFVRARRRQ